MKKLDLINQRLYGLIEHGHSLEGGASAGQVKSSAHQSECEGWITAALHLVQVICPDPNNAYHLRASKISNKAGGYIANRRVGEFTRLLEQLEGDLKAGLLTSIANSVSAEIFDDFLEHAKKYLSHDMKNESGVIAGVVFEDSLRKVCTKNGIDEKGRKVDDLISALANKGALTAVKAKRARAAADVRTKATHAQWDDFQADDVKAAIDFTEYLISDHLDS